MTYAFRPNLAFAIPVPDMGKVRYPVYVSNKLDGIRCIVRDGVCVSRSNKPIPNKYVQSLFSHLEGFDGELIVGVHDCGVFRRTTSGVMSIEGAPNVHFCVFDIVIPNQTYTYRLNELTCQFNTYTEDNPRLVLLQQELVHEQCKVDYAESLALENGYEGLILRSPNALYKHGRSTISDQGIIKLKRFVDDEAVIIGYFEEMGNLNEATINERGYTQRSSNRDNLYGKGVLGGVLVLFNGIVQRIGSGFTATERVQIWNDRRNIVGKLAKFKHFTQGVNTSPLLQNKLRHSVWLGFRHTDDT